MQLKRPGFERVLLVVESTIRPFFLFGIAAAVIATLAPAQTYGTAGLSADYSRVIENASFEFSNARMYIDQNAWVGRTISFVGRFANIPDVINDKRPYEQVIGEGGGAEYVDVLTFFDTRPPFGGSYGDRNVSLMRGEKYRFFGVVQKCREVITRTGVVRVLPVLDLLLIYPLSDQAFSKPLWANPSAR